MAPEMAATGGALTPMKRPAEDDDGDAVDYSDANFDEFSGYGGSLFANAEYEEDDAKADAIWDAVDARIDERRKTRREERLKSEVKKYRQTRPKIQQQFADLKQSLKEVSLEQWANIPEAGDHRPRKRQGPENKINTPDSLLEQARQEHQSVSTLSAQQQLAGYSTPMGIATPSGAQDLTKLGEARKAVMEVGLQKMSDSVTGQTVVDPKGYLTDLQSIKGISDGDVSDIKRARLLLKSVTQTNPKHGPGWIAAARLEEVAGKLVIARKLINQGCQKAPDNEDVWLEAARLHTPANAKVILARAVKVLPTSINLWLKAAGLETDVTAKKKVLRRALEFVPNSVKLWQAAIELEEEEDARLLLTRAVECVPESVEMWLALAKLETYNNARKVLNTARKKIPTEKAIWITAAALEEANGNEEGVKKVISRGIKSLSAHGVMINREQWLEEAQEQEKAGNIATCQAIVQETIGIGIDEEDRKATWMEDAESCLARECVQTARAIYAYALAVFPGKKSIWMRLAQVERAHGTPESLDQLLEKALRYCPQAELLWLMRAKERWVIGDVNGARQILHEAFNSNPDSEQIWLAAVKLENANNEIDRARKLLERARQQSSASARIWMKACLLEREQGKKDAELALLKQLITKFPQYAKGWMMLGQFYERENNHQSAKTSYTNGLLKCPKSIPLWVCTARCEEKQSITRARAILEKARLRNPHTPELWLEAVRLELRGGNDKMATALLSKAFQDCPHSGLLWAEAITLAPRSQRRSKSVEALKICDQSPHVLVSVAKLFWSDRKIQKAFSWFNRAMRLDPDFGDGWATFYKFAIQHGSEEQQEDVLKR